jgi:hypothetical protein
MTNQLVTYELARGPVKTFAAADRAQAEMLDILRQSAIDPVAYAGLTYCGPDHCGRVGCSEACWFGYVRPTLKAREELRRLIADNRRVCYVHAFRAKWSQDQANLQLDPLVGARLVRRVLDGLHPKKPIAFGTLNVEAQGGSYWRWYVDLLVAGPQSFYLDGAFGEKGWPGTAYVKEVENSDKSINEVLDYNVSARLIGRMLPKRTEFYKWLLQIEAGSRFIRYRYKDR